MKPIRIRPRTDIEIDALADYIACDSFDAAMRFLDAVQKSFDLIGEQPGDRYPALRSFADAGGRLENVASIRF